MALFILGKWVRGILLTLLGMLISFGINYILFSMKFVSTLGVVFAVGIIVSLIYSFFAFVALMAKDHVYLYEDSGFWSETVETYSRKKVMLYMLPLYITAVLAIILTVVLYPFLVQGASSDITVNDVGGASILPTSAIFLTTYALHMILWCHRATCPNCKNVMTREFISKSDESNYTEVETKYEKRREKVGELMWGETKIADINGDVEHRYDKVYDVNEYTEHYVCNICGKKSAARYKDRSRKE